MQVIIITCPKLVMQRLPPLVGQLGYAISKGLVSNVQIICMTDHDLTKAVKLEYRSDLWEADVSVGWPKFKANILTINKRSLSDPELWGDSLTAQSCFPRRELSSAEASVAMRHIRSWQIVAHQNEPCLILEDDVVIKNQSLFTSLLRGLNRHMKNRLFYDLCDEYIPVVQLYSRQLCIESLNFAVDSIATTRTLMAYAISPGLALHIMSSMSHFSLPIDMQLQAEFCRLAIPGVSLLNSPFIHGSKSGAMVSSINQI